MGICQSSSLGYKSFAVEHRKLSKEKVALKLHLLTQCNRTEKQKPSLLIYWVLSPREDQT